MIYLASPYSHKDSAVQEARYGSVCRCAAWLLQSGYHVFSPIAHTHGITKHGGLPKGWDFWQEYDRAALTPCAMVMVLCDPGWRESKGVSAEVKIAREQNKLVWYIIPETASYRIELQQPE